MEQRADFNPLNHPVIFQEPEFFSTVSAWVSHCPFAYLLMDLTRPRVLVELGTHQGDSYIAFCQTVAALNLETRCFAVDTWKGDSQAGFYDDAVLRGLRGHHDPHYSGFSTLIQTTFDEAATRFDGGTIDILHIDGLHTYDAVKHDFETWRAKLSDRAVVLFHDTAPQNRPTFGVHRLWDELSAQFPAFEFKHGGGLGVLVIGGNPPPPLKSFIDFASTNTQRVRQFFEAMGRYNFAQQRILCTAEFQMAQYELLRQWRARTGQPELAPITLQQTMHGPQQLAHFIALEVQRAVAQPPNVIR